MPQSIFNFDTLANLLFDALETSLFKKSVEEVISRFSPIFLFSPVKLEKMWYLYGVRNCILFKTSSAVS